MSRFEPLNYTDYQKEALAYLSIIKNGKLGVQFFVPFIDGRRSAISNAKIEVIRYIYSDDIRVSEYLSLFSSFISKGKLMRKK